MADLCPLGAIPQLELSSGIPSVGGLLFFYVAGSVGTKLTTYTDSTGSTPNTNPVVLDSLGMPANGIWLTHGVAYKIVYAPAGDTDPPTSPIRTIDNVLGISTSVSADQWVASGMTPTYINTTSFSVPGDQTSVLMVGRRLKTTIGAGTGYHSVITSVFGAGITTITTDGTALDAGLSAVSYGLVTPAPTSIPWGYPGAIGEYARSTGAFTYVKASGAVVSGAITAGFHGEVATGANKFNAYCDGTAANYFAGSVCVGTTSFTDFTTSPALRSLNSGNGDTGALFQQALATGYCHVNHNKATAGDNLFVSFGTEAAYTVRGSIDYNRAGGQVRYNVTSDIRLKTDLGRYEDTTVLRELVIHRYTLNETGHETLGVFAQEAYEVWPDPVCVGGDDPVKNPWTVDYSKYVPHLIMGWQDHQEYLSQLEERIEKLESMLRK